MNQLFFTFLTGLVFTLLASCSEESKTLSPEVSDDKLLQEITWDALLPVGEEEVLNALHEQFYTDLDRRILETPRVTLAEAARSGNIGEISEGSSLDEMPQLGTFNTVEELDGQHVRLPGFIVPIEFEGRNRLKSFLIVPYFGACIHNPPPPPNQIVFATVESAIKTPELWDAFWFEGILHTKRSDHELGNTAYTMDLHDLKPYK